jgi:dienelactone hydrolase/DNA-binding beta-propeller fold protein YncE
MPAGIRYWATRVLWGLAFLLVLGSRYVRQVSAHPGPLQDCAAFVVGVADSREEQWLIAICVGVYFVAFAYYQCLLRKRIQVGHGPDRRSVMVLRWCWPDVLLWLAIGWAAVLYAFSYQSAYQCTDLLALLAGVTAGQAVAVVRLRRTLMGCPRSLHQEIALALVFVAVLAAVFHPDMGSLSQYRGHVRWSGPYSNPNLFGLVMGIGVVLAVGMASASLKLKAKSLKLRVLSAATSECGPEQRTSNGERRTLNCGLSLKRACMVVAAAVMGVGLVKSYSRGAWIGSLCGLGYLGYAQWRLRARGREAGTRGGVLVAIAPSRWQITKGWRQFLPGGVILLGGLLVLAFLNLRYAEFRLVRRAFSVANRNDFSWRNRVVTSVGALQMIADRPLAGFGWNRYEDPYNQAYRPSTLYEGSAIVLDDYLVLGMTLGLPALLCLLWYVGWKFVGGHRSLLRRPGDPSRGEWEMATCRAAFLVPFLGFIPETGLFYLALGAPFWILLELGAAVPAASEAAGEIVESSVEKPEPKLLYGLQESDESDESAADVRLGARASFRATSRPSEATGRDAGARGGTRTARYRMAGAVVLGLGAVLACACFISFRRERESSDSLYQRIQKDFRAAEPLGVSVSPDGHYVLVKNEDGDGFKISVTERGSGRVVAASKSRDTQRALTWRPDGGAVAFQETAGMERPLCLWDVSSGKLTRINAPISRTALPPLRWSPDGSKLAYFQGDWRKGRLLVIRPGGHASKIVIKEPLSEDCDFVWSPDGGSVAVVDEAEPGGITLTRLADMKQSRLLLETGGKVRELAWSPDGSSILATVRGKADEYYKLFEVEVKSGKGTPRAEATGDVNNPVWLPDGRGFLYQILSNGVTSMVLGSRAQPCMKVVGPTNGVLWVSHVAADGSRAYARYAGFTAPPALVEIPLGGNVARPGAAVAGYADPRTGGTLALTSGAQAEGALVVYAPANSAEVQYPEPASVSLKSSDGKAIPAYHWRASGRAGPPKGALVVVHGGLHTQTFPTWEGYIRAMLDQGCDVIAVNYRGSSGYGQRFERMEGEAERVMDVLAARDYAVKALQVPPGKVYLSGISHGASLAAAAAAQGEEIGGLLLISWAGPIRGIEARFTKPFPIIAFHGELDASVSEKWARVALEEFVSAAGGRWSKPKWRAFKGEGHFFYRTASWAEVYWETSKLMEGR